jgi:N-acetyl-gamma-glutamyl-phosphate reductase
MNENLFAYAIGTHRHTPEMEQIAGELAGSPVRILFQPHVAPFDRGMLSTVYCRAKAEVKAEQLMALYADFYKGEPFVQICKTAPATKDVTGTNYCHVFPTLVKGQVVVFSAIDNLTKGASGQAIQNMNILFGLNETTGLE